MTYIFYNRHVWWLQVTQTKVFFLLPIHLLLNEIFSNSSLHSWQIWKWIVKSLICLLWESKAYNRFKFNLRCFRFAVTKELQKHRYYPPHPIESYWEIGGGDGWYMLNQHLCKEQFSEGMRVEGQSNKLSVRENGIFLVMEQGKICTALQSHT